MCPLRQGIHPLSVSLAQFPAELLRLPRSPVDHLTFQDQLPGNHGNGGLDPVNFRCELDPKLTEQDLPFFIPDIKGTWGAACGRNRGVFVIDPPDGHTYGEKRNTLASLFLFGART